MSRRNISVTNPLVDETLGSCSNASKLIESAILFYLKYASNVNSEGFITKEDLIKAIQNSNSQENRDKVYKDAIDYTLVL